MRRAIFIGYRRNDSGDSVGRTYDALTFAFGEHQVFRDVDNMPLGADFAAHIKALLPKCRVFLAFIGPSWLESRDAAGRRRLDDPDDLVRIEIERALTTPRLLVVPVLVNGAAMPAERDLPPSLQPLARRHAAIMRPDPDFRSDVGRLVEALRDHLRTGRLNLQSLGGAARVVGNAASISVGAVALWIALAGAVATTSVPQLREPIIEAGSAIVSSLESQPKESDEPAPQRSSELSRESASQPPAAETDAERQRRIALAAEAERARLEAAEQQRQQEEAATELGVWQGALSANAVAAYEDYLAKYPNGTFEVQARQNIAQLNAAAAAASRPVDPLEEVRTAFVGLWTTVDGRGAGLTSFCTRYLHIRSITNDMMLIGFYNSNPPGEVLTYSEVQATPTAIRSIGRNGFGGRVGYDLFLENGVLQTSSASVRCRYRRAS
jgi:hypothetical protein